MRYGQKNIAKVGDVLDRPIEKYLNNYIAEKEISISVISDRTGISKINLYHCFRENRKLEAKEFLLVCNFLGIDPSIFLPTKDKEGK